MLLGLSTLLLLAAPAASDASPVPPSLETFLKRVDVALASREWQQLAALSDTKSWREAGYPELQALQMVLPKGPLARDPNPSDSSVLYKDPAGHSWRLTLRHDAASDAWLAVIRTSLCPRSGMRPRPGLGPDPATPSVTTWTILECSPLPM